jgi:hypothetical protein
MESIPPAYVAWRAGTSNRPARLGIDSRSETFCMEDSHSGLATLINRCKALFQGIQMINYGEPWLSNCWCLSTVPYLRSPYRVPFLMSDFPAIFAVPAECLNPQSQLLGSPALLGQSILHLNMFK